MPRERRNDGTQPPQEPPKDPAVEPKIDELDRALEEFVAEHGTPLAHGIALSKLVDASDAASRASKRLAEDRYLVGEKLVEFAAHKGHLTLGYKRLGPCLKARFGLGRDWAYDSMRFAKAATRADIHDMEWEVAELGLELLPLLDVKTFAELKQKPLPVLTADMEPATFPARPEILKAAIEELERLRKPAPPEEEDPRAVERAAQRKADEIVEKHLAKYPELRAAQPNVFIRDGVAQLNVRSIPLRADTFAAVARLFAEIERAIRRT